MVELRSIGDTFSLFELYSQIKRGDYSEIVYSEPLIPGLYYITPSGLDYLDFLFLTLYASYVFIAIAVLSILYDPFKFLCIIIFFDFMFSAHLFGQAISSTFIILGLSFYFRRKIQLAWFCGVFALLAHNTAVLFMPLAVVFANTKENKLRAGLVIGLVIGLTGVTESLLPLLVYLFDVPVLSKAFFALEVYQASGAVEVRLIALIAAVLYLFFGMPTPLDKVVGGFLILMLCVATIPILNARVGFIGSSVLTGLAYYRLLALSLGYFGNGRPNKESTY